MGTRRSDLHGFASNLVVVIMMMLLFLEMTCCYCLGSIRQFPDPFYCPYSFSIVQLIQTTALIRGPSYDTDRRLLTRSTYLSDHGLCTAVPVVRPACVLALQLAYFPHCRHLRHFPQHLQRHRAAHTCCCPLHSLMSPFFLVTRDT